MKKIIASLMLVVFLLVLNVHGQDCPTIRLSSPDILKAGEKAVFTANVSGLKTVDPTYNWSVSSGSIESGQGTASITVNTDGLGGQSITATLELGGLSRECVTTSSTTTMVDAMPAAELHSKGDYSTANEFADEANKFAGDIMSAYYSIQAPHAIVYLYPGKNATAASSVKAMAKAMREALASYGMASSRYKIITGGKRDQTSYEMWIVPVGVNDPEATPVK